ncbi:MAG: hypothetical protein D0531_10910 [Methylococcales bacterium]|nr:MAG: hypothetical protein D0531_10910 [Methylococcales bacterium]
MNRSQLMDVPHCVNDTEFVRQIAFHEAGHATAIHIRNTQEKLPPIYFQIYINHAYHWRRDVSNTYEHDNSYLTKIENGRLIHTLPCSVAKALSDFTQLQKYQYQLAFEADIVNLLAGPLSEANYVALRDNEPLSPRIVNLDALHYYGGSSDLATINEYIDCLELSSDQRKAKITALFLKTFAFIKDSNNWRSILALAEYIISSNKSIIDYADIASVLDNQFFVAKTQSWY